MRLDQKTFTAILLLLLLCAGKSFSQLSSADMTIAAGETGEELLGMRKSKISSLDRTGTQWHPYIEWSIENPTYAGNPFDLIAAATFKHTGNGEIRKTEMFYAGESIWKFRFTGTYTGEWEFTTSSEDPDLDGKKGTVTIIPNPDPDMHGFVTQFGNKWGWQGTNRAFVPQLVMYDNPAAIYQNPEKIDKDIQTFFKEHGFNGFHTSVYCRWFDLHKERSHQIETPNPDFRTFEALELLITKTHIAGGLVHIWQWGDEERKMTPHKWGLNGQEDKRLMRYIAARLGPIPGWTMGYGFDCNEWVMENDLKIWHTYMHDHFGWSHFIGARDPNPNYSSDPLTQIYEDLDYSGYEHFRPSYNDYVRTIEGRPSKPSFSEDRFRIRMPPKYPKKDYDEDMTRRGLYNSTMAGGVANIWGNAYPGGWTAGGGSKPYPHPEWIMTYACFFNKRFLKDMTRENQITDGVCLKRPDNRHFVFYKEDAVSIQMDLSKMKGDQSAVAVDTKNIYTERSLGLLDAKVHTWTAPYKSDWVIAVGDFGKPE